MAVKAFHNEVAYTNLHAETHSDGQENKMKKLGIAAAIGMV